MHFSEHTSFHFPENCSAVHPEDIFFFHIYVMEITVKVPSWMRLSYAIGLLIMKGKLFIRQCIMTHDTPFYGSLVVPFIKASLVVISYFACMQQCKSFPRSIAHIHILCFDHFSHYLVTCIFQNIPLSTFWRIAVQFIQKTNVSSSYMSWR